MGDARLSLPRLLVWWALTRTALLGLLFLPAERQALHDLLLNRDLSHRAWCEGLLPGRDFSWEYPPGAIPFAAPPLGCGGTAAYSQLFMLLVLVLDLATLLVLRRLPQGDRAALVWLAAFPLLGPVAVTRFDTAVCLFLAAAFVMLTRHPARAGGLLAMAVAVKIWPVFLAVPTTLLAGRRRFVLLGAGMTTAALSVLFVVTDTWHAFVTTWQYQQHRGLQVEAVTALPFAWARAVGTGGTEFRFGSWQVTGSAASALATLTGAIQVALAVVVILVAASRRRVGRHDTALLGTCLTAVLLVTGKVLSPQYLLWLVVMVAIARGTGSALPRGTVRLTLVTTALTQLVYPVLYAGVLHGGVAPTLVLTTRNLLLAVVAARLVSAVLAPAPTLSSPEARTNEPRGIELAHDTA